MGFGPRFLQLMAFLQLIRVGFSPPLLFLIFGFARQPTHVPVFFRPPSWRPGHFLLPVQEKVTKENTPSVPRPARSAGCATGSRGFADRPSMACGKSAVRGLIRPPFAASQRVP